MEVTVSDVSLEGPMTMAYLEQEDFTSVVCAICDQDDESLLLADIRCGELTSLESAFCKRCEHRYFREVPRLDWFQRYYATTWDTGRSQSVAPLTVAKGFLRKVPLARSAWRLTRQYLYDGPKGRLDWNVVQHFSFLLGVVESNEIYYLRQPNVKKVLEVGCGYGDMLEVFRRKGFHVFGTEASPRRAQSCRDRGLNVLDCGVDNFKPLEHVGPFDLAYSNHVLEHIADPASHLKNLASIIQEEGYLYVQVPHLMHEVNFFHQCHTPVHCHSFSPRSLSLLLERHGFTPVRMQVDINIHILARKTPRNGSSFGYLPAFRNTVGPDELLESYENLEREQGIPLTMIWDHAHVEIKRIKDQRVVYKRQMNFNIAPLPRFHSMDFSFRFDRGRPSFPVTFNHEGHGPPVWIKVN